ncbi:MAG: murein biosynthesis integral membrane protein MurJ [gamma proteobacterium symbiont of Bathyaustriella thionipta]|nr:murein biosynthesis integral membrane protein MurJ [gamma proteobacterium symbiont of Bathyaustriella thionipta]MCU7949580.1 murein biosynthesis integral membrane protein MurJ [gamma proteobacterium symbiont of Bathyaustriella thionipta]MCU7952820.1 murein biosynthesis integral membrane protein MurJ [gamma proteobacterium symbiont of Bathyaustriella thionipta]MCU7956172.1 murein biosynthesis integral membrane protein MurJ [gamma proteobacterium symbiont of Bathyaustriella thionipta]MCU796758
MSLKLFKSTLIVSAMTLLSRVLGFIRDVVFAREFGASAGMDAFLIAFKIPNFMRRLFAEGAFNQAFVPTLGEYKENKDKETVKDLIQHVFGTLGGWLFMITLMGVIAAPIIIMIFAPGYLEQQNQYQYELTVNLLRITFPYILFISLVAFAGGILNTYQQFAVPAFTPVLLNVVLISATYWIVPMMDEPVMGLAIGVFLAGLLQLLFQLPFISRMGFLSRPRWNRQHPGVKKILTLMLPAIFGASVAQINLLLDTIIASLLVTGSISWLYYSDRLMEFPLGILGVALATVILPSLSKQHVNDSKEEFSATLDKAIRWVIYLGMPSAIGLFMLAAPIITTLFGSEKFLKNDIEMSAMSLMAYSFGLLGFILVKVLLPGFYSRQDTKTPVKIGIKALIINMVFNIAIVVPWFLMDYPGAHAGLAIATSISAFSNAFLLYRWLRKHDVYWPASGWGKVWLQAVIANSVMLVVLWLTKYELDQWLNWPTSERIIHLLLTIALAIAVYFACLFMLGVRKGNFFPAK